MTALVATGLAIVALTNSADVASVVLDSKPQSYFDLTGVLTFQCESNGMDTFAISDGAGAVSLKGAKELRQRQGCRPGDVLRVQGVTTSLDRGIIAAICTNLALVSRGKPSEIPLVSGSDINGGRFDNRPVRVRGVVRERFRDEIDPEFFYLILRSGRETIISAGKLKDQSEDRLRRLMGASVEISGLCLPADNGYRRMVGRIILQDNLESAVILKSPPADPFDVPQLSDLSHASPSEIASMGRRRVSGFVLGRWNGQEILMRSTSGSLSRIGLSDETLPDCGAFVEVSGFPTTDLFHINLVEGVWRPAEAQSRHEEAPARLTASQIFTDGRSRTVINPLLHGKTIVVQGIVQDTFRRNGQTCEITLRCDGHILPVNTEFLQTSKADIPVGSTLQATGVCVVETENWKSGSAFPHATGLRLITRTPADLRILSLPPWWTPVRLIIVILSLAAALIAIFVWNRILNRLVERRSRQLLREQAACVGEKLKVSERTRLAVELHDALSQTLTGIAFQIDAAEQARQKDPSQVKRFLDVARQSLKSCREELRDCLWDLRNNALEETDSEIAIRKTIEPRIGDAELTVDVKVARKTLTDNTFHAILCILRELSVNAIRHGKAKHVWLTGRRTKEHLTFSVRDDGCGFDPNNHPGVEEGHFGLLGIQERVGDLGGIFTLNSAPGRGTSVTIELST